MHFCNYWHVMPWLTERSSGSSRLTSEALRSLFLTDVLSAIQVQKFSFYTWITGKTSLSKQRFPADVGYTSWCGSIFIGSFPWTFFKGSGSHLLSHAVSSIVSSAASVLTIVFGMGTGVPPKRIATGNVVIKLFSLVTQQWNTDFYFFFRFSWIVPDERSNSFSLERRWSSRTFRYG